MNIKRVPCLAVVTRGPNRDRIVAVEEADNVGSLLFGVALWLCSSASEMKLWSGGVIPVHGVRGSFPDNALRPIDDPGEPVTEREQLEVNA